MKNQIRILIAAGGSGGHLLPAIEVAKKLQSLESSSGKKIIFEFVGVGRPVETTILKPLGYVHHVIPGIGLKGSGVTGLLSFVVKFPKAYFKTKSLLSSFKPDIVVGFGGHPSFFPVIVSFVRGVPTWIHEADSSAGLATKVLSLFATKISVAFERIELPLGRKGIFTGHPIRSEIEPAIIPDDNFVPKNILVLGGSQGASSLDQAVPQCLANIKIKDLSVVHQSRQNAVSELNSVYLQKNINAKVESFISDMPAALKKADLIVSRAGAGAVMELSVLNKPVIFVPLPKVSGHQLLNARSLESRGKALIVEEGENFESRLQEAIEQLLLPENYLKMIKRPKLDQNREAALNIAEGVLKLI